MKVFIWVCAAISVLICTAISRTLPALIISYICIAVAVAWNLRRLKKTMQT